MTEIAAPDADTQLKIRRVYALDDNREMCRSLDALLSSAGYDLRYYTSPRSFLEERHDLDPGALLLDMRMPEMDGLEVLTCLQSDLEKFPTIVITAHGEIDTAVKSIKLGARDFLQKPFNEDALFEILERELSELKHPLPDEQTTLLDDLTPRERDVVLRLARGQPNKAIAHELDLSVRTVEMHRARAMQRLGCRNFADLLRLVFNSTS